MITTDLFNEVLIRPVDDGADELLVVSGYATSAMAFHHLDTLRKAKKSLKLELIVGMPVSDGLSLSNHRGFQKITDDDFVGRFHCSYIYKTPAVHSKVYTWLRNGRPVECFVGSANYSQNAFRQQREALSPTDPQFGFDYFKALAGESIFCNHLDVDNLITIFSDNQYRGRIRQKAEAEGQDSLPLDDFDTVLPFVTVSLLDRTGNVPERSGLNWGQRPELNRNPNQAYIQLNPQIYKGDFFPEKGVTFTVLTDDGVSLLCKRAQKRYGEAIETPQNNSLLGEYFRNRLGLANGAKVETEHLRRYGRTTIEFSKIDDETFQMDFSRNGE